MATAYPVKALLARGGERIADHLELLAAMGRDFAQSRDIDATLTRALERIVEHLDAAGGALFLLADEGRMLRCRASAGATRITGLELASDAGIVGRCVQSGIGEIVRDVADDPDFYNEADEKTGFTTRSILCAPLGVQDDRIGAIELVNKRGGDGLFSDADLHLLQGLASSAGLAILNARMAEALVEQERVRRELELAAEIQRTLLPSPRPLPFPAHGINIPAREVSGDFYDFFTLDDGRICFNVGDVSGKGMNAALLMAKTAALFRCLGKTVHDPGRLFAIVNEEVCETASRGMFVTMAGGLYDPATGRVRLVNAGHEPALLRRPDGTYESFPAEAPPLGIVPGGDFPEAEGLRRLLDRHAAVPVDGRIDLAVEALRGEGALRDDVTLLALEGFGVGGGPLMEDRFPAEPGSLALIRDRLRQAVAAGGAGDRERDDIVLAVDEACQNVIRHAYGAEAGGEMVVTVRRESGGLAVLLRDFAKPVDPAKIKPRDLNDLRPGGLGTHFINQVMDDVAFLPPPDGRGNLLRLFKRIGGKTK